MAVRELTPTKIDQILPYSPTIQLPKGRPISEDGKRVSKEVYWEKYYEHPDFVYEWNDGILEIKPMAKINQSNMYRWFLYLLESYLRVNPIATLVMLEIGFDLPLASGERVRIPDLGVVCHDNPIPAHPDDHNYTGTFDMCIESLSDSNSRQVKRDTEDKWLEYAQSGVKEYYILDDQRNRHMEFFYLASNGFYQPIPPTSDGVIRSLVLPGFQFRIDDLYRQPSLGTLVDHPVYEKFVWPENVAANKRADSEKERADSEKDRADSEKERADSEKDRADNAEKQAELAKQQAKQQAENFVAKLRELGIDPVHFSNEI